MKNYNPKILLIYNQEKEALEIDNYLKNCNFRHVFGTNDVPTAVKFCETNKVDVILSNLEMNNYCVVKRLLEKRALTGIPIVFYSFKEEDFKKYSRTKELSSSEQVKVLFNPSQGGDLNNSIVRLYQLKMANKFTNYIFAKSKLGELEKISFSDIKFLQSDVAHCKIHTKWGVYKTCGSLAKLHSNLNNNFIKVHEKYIVNVAHVSNFSSTKVIIDGIVIPASRTNHAKLKTKFEYRKMIKVV